MNFLAFLHTTAIKLTSNPKCQSVYKTKIHCRMQKQGQDKIKLKTAWKAHKPKYFTCDMTYIGGIAARWGTHGGKNYN